MSLTTEQDNRWADQQLAAVQRGEFCVLSDPATIEQHPSGFTREFKVGKVDYSLIYDGPLFERYAIHMTKGAANHGARNWMKAETQADIDQAKGSLCRHMAEYMAGEPTEDHAAAIMFNLNFIEYVKGKLAAEPALGFTKDGKVRKRRRAKPSLADIFSASDVSKPTGQHQDDDDQQDEA